MIRPLVEDDIEAYTALRRRSLLESPLHFGASPEDDTSAAPAALRDSMRRAPDWMLFGAFEDGALAGAVGLVRGRHAKSAHRLLLWGMYVDPAFRGRGLGRALLEACIAQARSIETVSWIDLSVTTAAGAARRLYERAGFRAWGTERDALRHEGVTVDQHHLTLDLR